MREFASGFVDVLGAALLVPLILAASACSPASSSAEISPAPVSEQGSGGATEPESPTEPETEANGVHASREGAWREEVTAISDLIAEDRLDEAEERANRLLAEPELPDDLAAHAEELRARAAARQAEPTGETVPVENIAEEEPRDEAEPAAPEPVDTWKKSFRVRIGVAGAGFIEGDHGLLQIDRDGVTFTPWNKGGRPWAVPWEGLQEAALDIGLWEARETIAIVERSAKKRYLARTSSSGDFLSAEPILRAVEEGRKRHDQKD